MDKAIKYYQMAAEYGVNMAIDALIRLNLYNEVEGIAFYPRSIDNYSFRDSLEESHLNSPNEGETF